MIGLFPWGRIRRSKPQITNQPIRKSWLMWFVGFADGVRRCILHSSSIDLFDFVSSLPPSINHIDHECSMQPYCYNIFLFHSSKHCWMKQKWKFLFCWLKKCWVSLQLAAPTRFISSHSIQRNSAGGLGRPASLLALSFRSIQRERQRQSFIHSIN